MFPQIGKRSNPPEAIITLEPHPSASTPTFGASPAYTSDRPRRHTITRPDSAMALLSDTSTDDEDIQQEAFDRISGILSSLIQEANDAVNGIEIERVQMMNRTKSTDSHSRSRLPRPKKPFNRPSYTHSSSSSSSTYSSSPSATPDTFLSRSPSPSQSRPPAPLLATKRSITPLKKTATQPKLQDPLLESFKRLDSSMALVESLSRDLATDPDAQQRSPIENRLTILLLLPLLHIPHAFLNMIFDFLTVTESVSYEHVQSSSFPVVIVWGFFIALANIIMNCVVEKPPVITKTRRLSLPGTYTRTIVVQDYQTNTSPLLVVPDRAATIHSSGSRRRRSTLRASLYRRRQPHHQHNYDSARTHTNTVLTHNLLDVNTSESPVDYMLPGSFLFPSTTARPVLARRKSI
ncbi:hypothetical protein J3Q64DRAFT_1702664 [Phycomyces blakesleeanus]|uniref:Uncharacterized protein n=2 Tax=Phycomyces blakesleeanus TaxID=4837 RepID=A0A162UH47_PHYB8|nr:hypothetical protein PHYBLDRAFT_78968 [Phycomyces blakesleeanus NRRL 1555(-)]OAD75173.1 hypothetical protein PHYBLDRAFT_78968 [Phycomyces blakesleeanus NRRL 1555(-)]|eukprot:XP_018293213.1 hypothetical protein PHYBLDRAFT_78968 [Phycomyces blakesleeanus NRRL 1555(-)]